MKREDLFEMLEACVLWIDKAEPETYGIRKELSDKGKKLADYLQGLKIEVSL